VNFVDLMGMEKQLLKDIENWNKFRVELVARNLDSVISYLWTHTFIMIHSIWKDWKVSEYTIWWQPNSSWNLEWMFNDKGDVIKDSLLFWRYKGSISFDTPKWMTNKEFVKNIYDEYKDYNENHQREFELKSKLRLFPTISRDDSMWNCSNFSTTILYRASKYDKWVIEKISNFDPTFFNWWLWTQFNY